MKEEFLHYVWRFLKFDVRNLHTVDGLPVQIVQQGNYEQTSGPDFFNAQIYIDNQLWVGNVEMHVKSSDWYLHNHQSDKNYQNVILHVVWEHDVEVMNHFGIVIPTLILKEFVKENLIASYNASFMHPQLPCLNYLSNVDVHKIHWFQNELLIHKLDKKSAIIESNLLINKDFWEELFTQKVFRNFGTKINGDFFEEVIKSIPYSIINKLRSDAFQIESLLFGQANMLPELPIDHYTKELKKEYEFIKKKFDLSPVSNKVEYFRLRPDNFPTIRISQFALLLSSNNSLFFELIHSKGIGEMRRSLKTQTSEYWNNHYVFDKSSVKVNTKSLSTSFVDLLLINSVLPFRYAYNKTHYEEYLEDVIMLYEQLKFEKNAVVDLYPETFFRKDNALDSQSLVYLNTHLCTHKKCLSCTIGNEILKRND